MADERQSLSPKTDRNQLSASEDAETRATRRELKQSSISDPVGCRVDESEKRQQTPTEDATDQRNSGFENQTLSLKQKRGHDQLDFINSEEQADDSSVASAASSKDRALRSEPEKKRHCDAQELKQSFVSDPVGESEKCQKTPTNNATNQRNLGLEDQTCSPKKKRGHDQLDVINSEEQADDSSVASAASSKDRALRSEPEKKRHRDAQASVEGADETKPEKDEAATENKDEKNKSTETNSKDIPQTSASAFAASGFGKLSSGASPFAGLGGSGSNGFSSPEKASLISFASSPKKSETHPIAAAPKLSFGSTASSSPFAAVSSGINGFASGHCGTSIFGTTNGAKPLSSFASGTAKSFQAAKSVKPFGAPDDDFDEEDDIENSEEEDNNVADKDRSASTEKEDDKSKMKLHKVEVDDGEADEATLLSVRAKMFVHESELWKERGAGMLKINVPTSCVEFDDNNAVVPGSFDASALQDDGDEPGHKVVRLLMRQDQTHRVILNTAIISEMHFKEKTSLKSTSVLFTAFEGDSAKPVLVTMRMTAANAKLFQAEVDFIQRELRTR